MGSRSRTGSGDRRELSKILAVFGSAAGNQFNASTSDIDFLVEYETVSPREHAACYFGLLFALESLFRREIDLVELSAIRNPYFLQAIAKDRVLIYAA
jgi:uncharacterized protein